MVNQILFTNAPSAGAGETGSQTTVNLVVGGPVVRTATGQNCEHLRCGPAVTARCTGIKVYNWGSGTAAPGWGNDRSTIKVNQFFASWHSPAGPTVSNIIQLQAYRMFNGANVFWENYWYAQSHGLVGFEGHGYTKTGDLIVGSGYIDSFGGTTPTRDGVCMPP